MIPHPDTIPDPSATPVPSLRVVGPPPSRLQRELQARIGMVHAMLEVDTYPELALTQLRQAQVELDALTGWLADQVLTATLLSVLEDVAREDTDEDFVVLVDGGA